jgi:tetratricopeptide (TPR) repeat protein
VDAKRVVAAGRFVIGSVHTYSGRLDQASVENKQALAISRLIGHVLHQSLSLRMAGQLKNWEGDYAEAVSLQSESLRIAREHNLLLPLLFGLWSYGVILTATADYDEALVMFEEGLALTEKVGDELLRLYPRLLNSLG